MSLRFDHAVIAVRDLAEARRVYRDDLGFDVYAGGRHAGLGTENAVVRFGLDYLELLAIYDEGQALAAGTTRASLVKFLKESSYGMLGFALATDDLDGLAERFRAEGLDVLGPFPMKRMRPDGVLLQWRLVVPGGTAWRRPWPFFIQWDMSDGERLAHETPGRHPNGAKTVNGVTVAVHDLDGAKQLYSRQLGLELADEGEYDRIAWAHYAVGQFSISLLSPTAQGDLMTFMKRYGEGLYQVWLASTRSSVADFFSRRDIPVGQVYRQSGIQGASPASGYGRQLVFSG